MKFLPIFLLLSFFILSACSSDDDKPTTSFEEEKASAEEQYNIAQTQLEERNYNKSAENFLEIERQYPYSKWAVQAQIQAAYAYYKNEKYDEAIGTLERFIKLNPGNENVAYAYYLVALSYYNQISNVERDQSITLEARRTLNDVVSRFPDSDYGRDSRFKLDLVEDHLAGKEMAVGRYYLERKRSIAAINRFKKVVEEYPTTAQVEEALHRLVEAYLELGVMSEAQKYAAVLGHNYPDSQWYKDSYDVLVGKNERTAANSDNGKSDDKSWYKVW
jgi:outer membrane protein assembly factor BamD